MVGDHGLLEVGVFCAVDDCIVKVAHGVHGEASERVVKPRAGNSYPSDVELGLEDDEPRARVGGYKRRRFDGDSGR